jgi:hypothetical protein
MAIFFFKNGILWQNILFLKKSQNGENLPPTKKKKNRKTMRQYVRREGQNFCNSQKGFAEI